MIKFENEDKKRKVKTNESFAIGKTVKIGFLTLTVIGYINNSYRLASAKGVTYIFVPYEGLTRE